MSVGHRPALHRSSHGARRVDHPDEHATVSSGVVAPVCRLCRVAQTIAVLGATPIESFGDATHEASCRSPQHVLFDVKPRVWPSWHQMLRVYQRCPLHRRADNVATETPQKRPVRP